MAACIAAAVAVAVCRATSASEGDVVELSPLSITERRINEPDARSAAYLIDFAEDRFGRDGLPTLARQLAALPGVVMQESFGGIDPPRITLRGSGLQSAPVSRGVLWTLDGLPLNATDGSFNSALVDPALLRAVSVAPGGASPHAAVTALGGAIRLHSPEPEAPARAWLMLGESGAMRAGASSGFAAGDAGSSHGAPLGAGTCLWAGLSHAAWDGWRPQSAQRRTAVSIRAFGRTSANAPRWTANLFAANPEFDIPGPLSLGAALEQPRTVSAVVAADRPRRETAFAHGSLELDWESAPECATRVAVGIQQTDDWFRQLRAIGISATRGPDVTGMAAIDRRIGVHRVNAGISLRKGTRDQSRFANDAGTRGERFAETELDATEATGWIDDRWELRPGLVATAGATFATLSREARARLEAQRGRNRSKVLTPRLAVQWSPSDRVGLVARASRGYEAPGFDDLLAVRGAPAAPALAWVPLRAQRSDTLELGLNFTRGPIVWSCTGYTARWHDELLRLTDANGASLGTVNAGPTTHRGIEAALRWRLAVIGGHSLDLLATHAWSRAVFDDGPHRGRHLAGLPPHAGSAQLTWSGERGVFVTVGANWVAGPIWADHANRLHYSGHILAHARLGWVAKTGWSVFADIDNCLDRSTIASTAGVIDMARNPTSTTLFLPGLPRQIRIGITWRR